MSTIFRKFKDYTIEAVAKEAVRLVANFSEKNLISLTYILERIALKPESRQTAKNIRKLIETQHPFFLWLKRVSTELNANSLDKFISNILIRSWFTNHKVREQFKAKHGFYPPDLIVISPTMRCNFRCYGCWAAKYAEAPDMDLSLLERIITEAKQEMGIHFFTITGGEPFLRKDLLDFYERHLDCYFQIYTNGVLIDEKTADKLAELGNVAPMISVEGLEESTDRRRGKGTFVKLMKVMEELHKRGVFFGFSATATKLNVEEITSDAFIDLMTEKGCLNGWYFQYVPIGLNPDPDLMCTPEQRDYSRKRIYTIRNTRPIFVADFWNDGPAVGGCMAGGKRYLHINCRGDIEPCVFVHFAVDNIREKSLTEALKSDFFRTIRNNIPYDGNMLRACMIIDRPSVLREYYHQFRPYPTDEGAVSLIETLDKALDKYAADLEKIYNPAWEKGDWMKLFPL